MLKNYLLRSPIYLISYIPVEIPHFATLGRLIRNDSFLFFGGVGRRVQAVPALAFQPPN